jgi:PKD repeat protein
MKNKIIVLSVLFSVFLFGNTIAQCNLYELSISKKVNTASDIFEGKVLSKTCFWNNQHRLIFTSNIIEVFKVFKGNITTSQVEIISEGGMVGDEMHHVEPSLHLNIGDIGIYMAIPSTVLDPLSKTDSNSVFQCYGSLQGFFKYDLVDKSANTPFQKYDNIKNDLYTAIENIISDTYKEITPFDVNQRASVAKAGGSITSFTPTTITAGTNSILTINGSGFGASQGSSTVDLKSADDGGASYISPVNSQYVSWSDTQIKVLVPDNAGTGTIRVSAGTTMVSTTTLTVSYAELNTSGTTPYQTDHVKINTSGGLTWQMYTGFNSNTAANQSFTRAFNTWRCATKINWIMGSTTTVNSIGSDGTSVIRFDSGSELGAGILGQCTSYWKGCNTSVWYVNELDMAIDDGANWNFGPAAPTGSQYDLESVMLHELGHGHQLGHVINKTDVMNYALSNASSRRTLNANNQAAGDDLMSRSIVTNSCGPGAMTKLTGQCAIGGPVADFSATPLNGCASLTVTFTDKTTNSPTSWAWDVDNNGTTDYTTQNPTHTYTTAGTYAVKLKVVNATGKDSITKTSYITVNPLPVAAFSNTINSGTVSFTNTSTNATSYSWNYGDNATSTSTAVNVSHTYSVTGTYTVTLTATNSCGNTSITHTVSINSVPNTNPPVANFSFTPASGCAPLSVSFTDNSTNTPTTWAWDVDNNGTIDYTTKSPTHIFSVAGNYTVKLKVSNANGFDSITKTNVITVKQIPTVIALSDQTICSGTSVITNAFSSNPNGATYTWTNSNTAIGLTASGSSNIPTFNATNTSNSAIIGNIVVTPTLNGCTGSTSTFKITVKPKPTLTTPSSFTICSGLATTTTSFTSTPTGTTYTWTNSNTTIGMAATGTGDIASFTTVNTTNAATKATVTVTPTLNGCTGTSASYDITVNPSPDATFSYSKNTFCQGDNNPNPTTTVAGGTFTSTSGLTIAAATGLINLASSSLNTYAITYTIAGKCQSSSTNNISITNNPDASFSYNSPFCEKGSPNPLPVFNTGTSAGIFASTTGLIFVNTGTGRIDLTASLPGTYTVTNSIAASAGCSATTATSTVTIKALPLAAFTDSVSGNTINLTNSSVNATTYIWNFGDTNTSSTTNVSHIYTNAGTYTITLTAGNTCGTNNNSKQVIIESTGPGTNVDEINNSDVFLIYPNPSTGIINIQFPNNVYSGNISIFNYLGEVINTVSNINNSTKINIDLSNLPNGMYCIVGNINGKIVSKTLVLVK